jgi:flavin-dependent dehydrogenase
MDSSYDVVVVGARVAGAAAARLLAQSGLDVLLLDRTRVPADTVSTHALMLGGVIQLRRWGLLDAVAATGATPVDGVDISAGDVTFTARVKPIGGVERLYAPRRLTLDPLLLDAARAAGVDVHTGVTVDRVLRDRGGRVVGVGCVDETGRPVEVRARWVVGADGIRSAVAGLVGARTMRSDPGTSASHYAYWSGLEGHRYDFAFGTRSGAGAIPTDGGLTCVFVNCLTEQVGELRRDLDTGFHRLLETTAPGIAEQVRHGERVTGYRGARALPAFLRQAAGPGWLLIGDAGYHRDPFSAHGITDAFRDAELAARAIRAAASGDDEPAVMQLFQQLRDVFALPMYDATLRLASYDWDTSEVLEILAMMGEEGEREARFLSDLPDLSGVRESTAA